MAPVPVRSTYAHKRSRETNINLPSFPDIDRLDEDITYSEMSRRMLKRSRHADEAVNSLRSTTGIQERSLKKLKSSLWTRLENLDSNTMIVTAGSSFVKFNLNDVSQFQTPHPSILTERSKLDSSIGRPIPPEQFSPLPIARHILSRRSSRNLKENASRHSRSRGLASPFHSRPGSVATSPKSTEKSKRHPLGSKSRSPSGKNSQNSQKRKPSASVTNSTRNSPRPDKKSLHNRRPSVPTPPSYMLSQISQHDWFLPPGALSRELAGFSLFSDSPSQQIHKHSPFLNGFAQAYSTPLHRRKRSNIGAAKPSADTYSPSSRYATPETTEYCAANHVTDMGDDIIMYDGTQRSIGSRHHRITAPSGSGPCSIISSDSSASPSPPISPSRYPTPAYIPSLFKNVDQMLAFQHLSHSPDNIDQDKDERDDSIFPPTTKLHLAEHLVPVASSSPDPLDLLIGPSTGTPPLRLQSIAVGIGGSGFATSPTSQKSRGSVLKSMSPVSEKLKEIFSKLDIDGARIPTHESGINVSDDPSHTHRMSRSLDSPVQIELRKPVNNNNINKEKRYGKRNRAGTIRASDFMQPNIANDLGKQDAPPLGGNGSIVTRRTRSGTVIGPSQSFTRTRSGTIIGPSRPAPSRPTVAPRNQQHAHTRPSGDLDLEAHAGKLPVLNSEDESEDELLLKGHWHDEDWVVAPALAPVCGRAKGKGKMRIWNKESVPPMEQDDGDKELLLVASKKGE